VVLLETRASQKSLVSIVAYGDREDFFAVFAPFALLKARQKAQKLQKEKHAEALPLHECDF